MSSSGKRSSRKRRKQRRASAPPPRAATVSRAEVKNEEARAALKPLRPGERPGAVTVGAVAATLLAVANLVALAFGYNASEDAFSPGSDATGTILAAVVLGVVAYGMWKARYWGVLGMQTLLALTIVIGCLALIGATSWWAALVLVVIVGASGVLFWHLVKAMARIQMPERPQRTS